MAAITVEFPFSIGEQVTVVSTERVGWIAGQFVGADGVIQFNVNTTKLSGEPMQLWARVADLAPVTGE